MNINEDILMMKAETGTEEAAEGGITCECACLIILDAPAVDVTNTAGHERAEPVESYRFGAFQACEW